MLRMWYWNVCTSYKWRIKASSTTDPFLQRSGRRPLQQSKTLLVTPYSFHRMETHPLVMPSYSWDKKTCWLIARKLGNILTGDGAAAPCYIEARLSKFALETVFNPKQLTGSNRMTDVIRNLSPCRSSFRFFWLREWRVSPWVWHQKSFRITSTNCWMPV